MTSKAILTCALNGVLTNPAQHKVPVTPTEMAEAARGAFNEGAAIMHIHFRDQRPGMGQLPTWDASLAGEISDAIRSACPGVIINQTTGIVGPDVSGPIACLQRLQPDIAACNAGSLNYLKIKDDGAWAWPPMLFDNPVSKIKTMLDAMAATGARPEFECFDLGIVRSVAMYVRNGMAASAQYNFVQGIASGMPVDEDALKLCIKYAAPGAPWQATLIGRAEIWPVHQRVAELGGMLRTGLEDTFYLPNGARAENNAELIAVLATCAHNAGRDIASPEDARKILKLGTGNHAT
jgi:uncharacterized protein (DUF849 family)